MPDEGTCRGCGAKILWAKTKIGKPVPLDPPVVQVITNEGEYVRGRVSHFATCPQAPRFRRGGPRRG